MVTRKRLKYEQLPARLASVVAQSDFIKSYDCADLGTIVVWFVDRVSGRQQEVEFSLREQCVLSRIERERDFPSEEEVVLPDQGLRVIKGNRLEQGTDVRYETYDVYPEGVQSKLFTCEQIYFSPDHLDIGDLVRAAARRASFSVIYKSWNLLERTNYWVADLYRLRRHTGEMGFSVDEVFGFGLVSKMKSIDENIELILPAVLNGLAAMELISSSSLVESFNSRTGLSVVG